MIYLIIIQEFNQYKEKVLKKVKKNKKLLKKLKK